MLCFLLSTSLHFLKNLRGEKNSLLFTQIFIISIVLPSFLMVQVSSCYHFLYIWSISFSISFKECLLEMNSLSFPSLRMSLFHLHFWRIFLQDIELWFDSSFFQRFKHFALLPSILHDSDVKSIVIQIVVPLYLMHCFSSGCFQDFSLCFYFLAVWLWYVLMCISLNLSFWGMLRFLNL